MGRVNPSRTKRRPRSDDPDPSWSSRRRVARVKAAMDCPDDESEYQSSVFSLDNLVESWTQKHEPRELTHEPRAQKTAVSTVVLPDAVETTLGVSDDEESIPPPAPPVEEYYHGGQAKPQKRGGRRFLLGGTLLALIVVAAVAVAVVIVPDRGDTSAQSDGFTFDEGDGSGTNEADDTLTTTTTDTDAPLTREEAFRNIVSSVSDDQYLDTSGSPQQMAFNWIVVSDPAQLDPSTTSAREIQERYILAVFFYATGGDNWYDRFGFMSQSHVCNWRNFDYGMGVLCDESTKVTTAVRFGPNNLQGRLPDEVFLLQDLVSFQIIMNPGLSGPIPDTISTLQNLEVLNLNKNGLGGEIPDTLLSLPSLTTLWMDENSFEGTIPDLDEDNLILQWWSCNNCGLEGRMPDNLRYPPLF